MNRPTTYLYDYSLSSRRNGNTAGIEMPRYMLTKATRAYRTMLEAGIDRDLARLTVTSLLFAGEITHRSAGGWRKDKPVLVEAAA